MYQAVGRPPVAQSSPNRVHVGQRGNRTSRNSSRVTYKPPAVRFVCLSIFLAIFAACIALIEWTISRAVDDETSNTSTPTSTADLNRRELTTITTVDTSLLTCAPYTKPAVCINQDQYNAQFASADAVYDDLCATYAASFADYTKNLLPSTLQGPFNQWTSAYSAQQTIISDVMRMSKDCLYDPVERCSDEWFVYNDRQKTYTMTVGCSRDPMVVEPPCWGSGGPVVRNGTVTTTSAMVCGAKAVSQLIITTDIEPTTSPMAKSSEKASVAATTPLPAQESPTAAVPAATGPTSSNKITTTVLLEEGKTVSQLQVGGSTSSIKSDVSSAPSNSQLQIAKVTSESSAAKGVSQLEVQAPTTTPTESSGTSTIASAKKDSQLQIGTSNTKSSESQTFESSAPSNSQLQIGKPTVTVPSSVASAGSALSESQLQIETATPSGPASSLADSTVLAAFGASSGSAASTLMESDEASRLLANPTSIGNAGSSAESQTGDLSTISATGTIAAVESTSEPTGTATATATNNTTKGDSEIDFTLSKNEIIVGPAVTHSTFFTAMFLPALIAVIIKSLWELIASSLKLIEPFQRLVEVGGAEAKFSMFTQYLDGMISWDIFRAMAHGRMVPTCSALIYIMVEVSPLIAAVSMTVKPQKMCLFSDMQYRPCEGRWIVNLILIRALEGFLALSFILVLCLMWLTRKSRIPVATNPGSIASLAALLNYEPLLRDLQKVDPDADGKLFRTALKSRLFQLTEHYDQKLDHARFGFVTSGSEHLWESKERRKWLPFSKSKKGPTVSYRPVDEWSHDARGKKKSSSFQYRRYSYIWTRVSLLLFTTVALLAIIVTYWLDSNLDDAFNRFFNGDIVPAIIPKAILVALAVAVDIQMKYLERVVRITDPFRRLAARNARAETTILLPLDGTCWSNLPRNVYLLFRYEFAQGRMFWVTIVSFVACVSDLNIIAVAGLLWNFAQTPESYKVCGYGSMACTSAILAVIIVTMAWWLNVSVIRRMPRQPDSVGSMLSYLCASEMVRDWNSISISVIPIEDLSAGDRDGLVKCSGRRFCFGRMLGVDDKERWCIDYERDHGQVMVVDDAAIGGLMPVPEVPERWQPAPIQNSRRYEVPVQNRREEPGWNASLMGSGAADDHVERPSRYPSLRIYRGPGWDAHDRLHSIRR